MYGHSVQGKRTIHHRMGDKGSTHLGWKQSQSGSVGAALSGWAQEALYCTGLLLDLEIGITQGCASPLGCTLLPDCACASWCMHSSGTLLLMGELPMHSSIGVLLWGRSDQPLPQGSAQARCHCAWAYCTGGGGVQRSLSGGDMLRECQASVRPVTWCAAHQSHYPSDFLPGNLRWPGHPKSRERRRGAAWLSALDGRRMLCTYLLLGAAWEPKLTWAVQVLGRGSSVGLYTGKLHRARTVHQAGGLSFASQQAFTAGNPSRRIFTVFGMQMFLSGGIFCPLSTYNTGCSLVASVMECCRNPPLHKCIEL